MNQELFEPYERLVEITIDGRTFRVPERNLLLRGLQFLAMEDVSCGDFCWNAMCGNCRVTLSRGGKSGRVHCCQTEVREGDSITELSPEARQSLRSILG